MKDYTLHLVEQEATSSFRKWGHYRSEHEAYGVLCEEMHELLEAIHKNDADAVRAEAMQVSAVAYRLASEGWRRD